MAAVTVLVLVSPNMIFGIEVFVSDNNHSIELYPKIVSIEVYINVILTWADNVDCQL
jgi:hypothetical protein